MTSSPVVVAVAVESRGLCFFWDRRLPRERDRDFSLPERLELCES
jgi:hypothetical protein